MLNLQEIVGQITNYHFILLARLIGKLILYLLDFVCLFFCRC